MELPLRPPPSNATLCRRCAALDFDVLFSKPSDQGPNLGRIALYKRGNCLLCDFFIDVLPSQVKKGDRVFYWYRLQSVLSSSQETPCSQFEDVIVLQLKPFPWNLSMQEIILEGPGIPYIVQYSQKSSSWLQPLGTVIDFEVPKRWLSVCGSMKPHASPSTAESALSLRLIDCATGTIVHGNSDQAYVTLSYVWGPAVATEGLDGATTDIDTVADVMQLPADIPMSIQDAITVTQNLGYQYLWVDKYCIDQNNSEEALSQIRQMDIIYQNSVLTIIDAAGSNPRQGLPGVRPNSRSPNQPRVCVGKLELVSTMLRPQWHIEESTWSTRAWTYQEDTLSRRKLIFTSEQLLFKDFRPVTFSEALDSMSNLEEAELQEISSQITALREPINIFPVTMYNHIVKYSGRNLSYEGDILNGILGLFRQTEKSGHPIYHIWGLPFSTGDSKLLVLFASIITSLTWNLKRPSARRKGFPSWSWVGWYGEVDWALSRYVKDCNNEFETCVQDIAIETLSGDRLAIADYGPHVPSPVSLSPFLYLRAQAIVVIRMNPERDRGVLEPGFGIPDPLHYNGICEFNSLSATTTEFLPIEDDYLAIVIGRGGILSSAKYTFLIVKRCGERWERVAITTSSCEERHEAQWQEIVLA